MCVKISSYLYSAFCKQTQFVLKDLKNNIKSTNIRMTTVENIHDRVYRHFKANLEVKDHFLWGIRPDFFLFGLNLVPERVFYPQSAKGLSIMAG